MSRIPESEGGISGVSWTGVTGAIALSSILEQSNCNLDFWGLSCWCMHFPRTGIQMHVKNCSLTSELLMTPLYTVGPKTGATHSNIPLSCWQKSPADSKCEVANSKWGLFSTALARALLIYWLYRDVVNEIQILWVWLTMVLPISLIYCRLILD